MRKLEIEEEKEVYGGEAVTITAIMALMAIGLVSIVAYKLFTAGKSGKVVLPGGYTFQWSN